MTPHLRELKKEALTFFRKWQASILQRVRDISITVQDQSPTQGALQGRGRGAPVVRGPARGGRGARGGRAGRGALTLATGPPRLPSKHTDVPFANRFPPIPNTLWTLPQERRKLFLHIAFLAIISLTEYSANAHLLLLNLTSCLNLPVKMFLAEEVRLAQAFASAALDVSPESLLSQKPEEIRGSRKWKGPEPGASLAPALIQAGIGTAAGSFGLTTCTAIGLLGPMAGSERPLCNMFSMNPAKPISKMIEIFSRDIQDFALLPMHGEVHSEYIDARRPPAVDRRFRLVIALGGWLTEDEDVHDPWKCLGQQVEAFVLRWETTALLNLGGSLETVIKSKAWRDAKEAISTKTIFTSIIESSWPSQLLKISKIIDNPWSVGMVRAEKAGQTLADAISRHKVQGERSVSLLGYGAPVPSEPRVWLTLKSVVSGRLVNVYSEHDYLLGFLNRYSNTHFGIAGLQEIQGADGVENLDVGELAYGHLGYASATGRILKEIGWDDLDGDIVKNEKPFQVAPIAGRR
ncbi:putative membrane protein-like protein [Emericellopsis cladophorae]|uniref:Membrane protein-like protein n=1 Tax=Emericellopsis cladophorae TaxID=2686198 RepID=A0A9P9XYT2_9HYPO|nr:putative membrane protein-like protein [Emericellopsis cladophorae]KAI6780384.1 putative membrane protein-like protein [Emericellopsis cladophorae]